jgi:hypothetical protein
MKILWAVAGCGAISRQKEDAKNKTAEDET